MRLFTYRSRSRSASPQRGSSASYRHFTSVDESTSSKYSKDFADRSRSRTRSRSKTSLHRDDANRSERDLLLSKWRKNYCATREEVSNKIEELEKVNQEDTLEKEKDIWTRSTPADLYYVRDEQNTKIIRSTPKLLQLCHLFDDVLLLRAKKVNDLKPKYEPPPRKNRARLCKHKCEFLYNFVVFQVLNF